MGERGVGAFPVSGGRLHHVMNKLMWRGGASVHLLKSTLLSLSKNKSGGEVALNVNYTTFLAKHRADWQGF